MRKTAIIMTVFNRRETTLKCLKNIYNIIDNTKSIEADVYMTDDGCSDGTGEAVAQMFPKVIIVEGDGNLFWAGGMNKAWVTACQHDDYDYFIWLNDDALLQRNSIELLFEPIECLGNRVIVSGAFKDSKGYPSYGGRDNKKIILAPNGTFQPIVFMNGNFTLIPAEIKNKLGYIDELFIHIGGDWDYGLRAKRKGISVVLTSDYVGITDRHDDDCFKFGFVKRIKNLYSKKHNPFRIWVFNMRHFGLGCALYEFVKQHVIFVFPQILAIVK